MTTTADAVVVGGGVVGASALFHLCALGARRVVLCERHEPGAGATGKSGAFFQFHFCQNPAETRLTQASLPYFTQWDEMVGAGSCGFVPAGYLRLEPAERADILRRRVTMLRELGVKTAVISVDDVTNLAPYLRTDGVAIAAYEPDSGHADATSTLSGFLQAAQQRGAILRSNTTVTKIRTAGGATVGVDTTTGPIEAPIVVLAAGVWSEELLRPLGLALPVTGALTQWIGLDLPAGSGPPAMTIGDGVSLSYFRAYHPGASRILLGLGGGGRRPLGIRETNPDETAIPAELIEEARARLAARLIGAAEARPAGGQVGPVSLTPDDLPIVDRHPGFDGLYLFAGDSGSSFKTAPALGRALAEWALHGQPESVDLAAFSLARFNTTRD